MVPKILKRKVELLQKYTFSSSLHGCFGVFQANLQEVDEVQRYIALSCNRTSFAVSNPPANNIGYL